MRTFFIFMMIFLFIIPNSISSIEINPRGIPTSYIIQKKRIKGYEIDSKTVNETKRNLRILLENFDLNQNQIEFLIDFYINTGFAESCYVMDDSTVFSIEKEVNGKALGYVQIMPKTATEVIDEVFEYNDKQYISKMENICQRCFDMSLRELKKKIKADMINQLNDHGVSMFVFYLKFSNRKWKDIPGFTNGRPKNTIQTQAEIWKKIWNTYLGKGTIKQYINRVKECKTLI